jgi:hypothetical protein
MRLASPSNNARHNARNLCVCHSERPRSTLCFAWTVAVPLFITMRVWCSWSLYRIDQLTLLGSFSLAGITGDVMTRSEDLLGRAVLELWADLPQHIQELMFEAAVSREPKARERLATELHDRHPRTAHPPRSTKLT